MRFGAAIGAVLGLYNMPIQARAAPIGASSTIAARGVQDRAIASLTGRDLLYPRPDPFGASDATDDTRPVQERLIAILTRKDLEYPSADASPAPYVDPQAVIARVIAGR